MRRALNRERSNVGRTGYADRIKQILLACTSPKVAECLVQNLADYGTGTLRDELNWVDVATYAAKNLNAAEKVLLVTPDQLLSLPDIVDGAEKDGYRVMAIPETVAEKIRGDVDVSGNPMVDVEEYGVRWNASFQFNFIKADQLTTTERTVYEFTDAIIHLFGGVPKVVREIRISETMRLESGFEVVGLWEPVEGRVVIKRDQLKSISAYAGTRLRELIHAQGGHGDVSREFELDLTRGLGNLASTMVQTIAPSPEILRMHSQTIAEHGRSRQSKPHS